MKCRHICALSGTHTNTNTQTHHTAIAVQHIQPKWNEQLSRERETETGGKRMGKAQINKQAIMPHEFVNSNH